MINFGMLATLIKLIFAKISDFSLQYVEAQLVEALQYKPEGRSFESVWNHRKFLFTYSFRPYFNTAIESASDRNEY